MHQQPPHTPLLASTNAAKSAHVSGVSGLVASLPDGGVVTTPAWPTRPRQPRRYAARIAS